MLLISDESYCTKGSMIRSLGHLPVWACPGVHVLRFFEVASSCPASPDVKTKTRRCRSFSLYWFPFTTPRSSEFKVALDPRTLHNPVLGGLGQYALLHSMGLEWFVVMGVQILVPRHVPYLYICYYFSLRILFTTVRSIYWQVRELLPALICSVCIA